ALIGAHALGMCHTDRSGYKGPWTFSPTSFTNSFYTMLLEQEWVDKKEDVVVNSDGSEKVVAWRGPKQYVDKATGKLMMLPTDMVLLTDKSFRKWVDIYAKDEKRFFDDFAKAFGRMLELGCKNLSDTYH